MVLAEFEELLKYPPKNAWNAVLFQLLCWSFRRFCVDYLNKSEEEQTTWDTYFELVIEYAPPQFHQYFEQWLAPEQIANVPNVKELDEFFRYMLALFNKSMNEDDIETQDKLSTFFDEQMSASLEKWLGSVYAPFSLFPMPTEADGSIDMTKLNAIIYLLGRQPSLNRNRRKTLRGKQRALTPVKTQIRKTRHAKLTKEANVVTLN